MHFYPGLAPMTWMTDVPRGFVRACLRMIPRLLAEQALQRTSEISVGTGSAGDSGKAVSDHWIRTAQAGRPTPAPRVPMPKMAAMGIGVDLVEAKR